MNSPSRTAPRRRVGSRRGVRGAIAVVTGVLVGIGALPFTAVAVVPTLATSANLVVWGGNAMGQATLPSSLDGKRVVGISAGWGHSLAVTADGEVIGWGVNQQEQATAPASLLGRPVAAVGAGDTHSVALTRDGAVVAWGMDNRTGVPAMLAGKRVTEIAVNSSHSLALTSDGVVAAWGDNYYGEIDVPSSLSGKVVTSIAAGAYYSLALTSEGAVVGWGNYGRPINPPASLAGKVVTAIAAGEYQSLALTSDGTLVVWGNMGGGIANIPASLAGKTITAISARGRHAMALTSEGKVVAWGSANSYGETTIPASLAGRTVTAISAGDNFSLALTSDGKVVGWGDNGGGRANPPASLDGRRVTAVAAGYLHSLALTEDGDLVDWGASTSGRENLPASLQGKTVTAIAAGDDHSLVLTSEGAVISWGTNTSGQTATPAVLASKTVTAIAAGAYHSLVVTSDGHVVAWGNNQFGQTDVPASLAGQRVTAVSGGERHSLALTSDGTVVAWGENYSGQTTVPASLAGKTVVAIAAGGNHSLALTSDGAVTAWGSNSLGETTLPAALNGKFVTAIAGGWYYSLALTSDGTVIGWGNNSFGQATSPAALAGKRVVAIAAGGYHNLVLVDSTRPDAPNQVRAVAGDHSATITWTRPGSEGQSPITGYAVTSTPQGLGCSTQSSSDLSCTIDGLTNGVSYTFTVKAANALGESAPSRPSDAVTPSMPQPPVVTGVVAPAPNGQGWNNSSVTVTWVPADPDDPSDSLTVPSPVTVSDEGQGQSITSGPSCDPAGNCATGSVMVSIDRTPPTISAATNIAPNGAGWFHGAVVVSFSCSDSLSGVATCPDPVTMDQQGADQQVTGVAVDRAGNQATATLLVSIDSSAPTVAAVLDRTPNAAGWNNTPVTVSWSATDSLGTATTPAAVVVTTEGAAQEVTSVPSCDAADNCVAGSTRVFVDVTPPTIVGTIVDPLGAPRPVGSTGWYDSAVRVHWTCTDALSGIAVCPADSYFAQDGTGYSALGESIDLAGNRAIGQVVGINIDSTAPSSSINTPCGTSTYCTGNSVTVKLTATDGGAGVAAIHVVVDQSTEQVFSGSSATVYVPLGQTSGSKTLKYWAVDLAGNVEPQNTALVVLDNVAPTIGHSVSPSANAAGWNDSDARIHWTATDDSGGSGIAYVTPDQTVTTETTGTTLTGVARDTAGNTGTDSVVIKLDKTSPIVTAAVTGHTNAAGYYVGAVTVTYTCSDGGGSGLVSCSSTVLLTEPGLNQTVIGVAQDAAGNQSTVVSTGINIAAAPPEVTITTPGNAKIRTANADQVTGTATTAGTITRIVATYTPQGAGRSPVTIEGTARVVGTIAGVTTYAWVANPPTTINGRMTVTITITDSYGQTTTSPGTSIVVT